MKSARPIQLERFSSAKANIACNRQEFELVALKLNDRVADSEREPSTLFNGESQRLIGRAKRLEIVAGEDQVVYTFHWQNLHALLDSQAILIGNISYPGREG